MMTVLEQPVVIDYLGRLRQEADQRLSPDQSRELVTDIEGHLVEALGNNPTDAEVRTALDRLGAPRELVDSAGGAAPTGADLGSSRIEAGALLLLILTFPLFWVFGGLVLPLWVGGLVLLVLSKRWSLTDKIWGGLVLGTPLLVTIAVARFAYGAIETPCTPIAGGGEQCTSGGEMTALNYVAIGFLIVYVVLIVYTIARLVRSARRKPLQ